jgi:hypothetical protein
MGSFTIAAGPRQRNRSRIRFPWDSRQYFTASDSGLPFSSPPTTRRSTVEVFDPDSTRDEWIRSESGSESKSKSGLGSESELLYDCRFTANPFVFTCEPLETHGQNFFLIEHLRSYPYITSYLTRGWVIFLLSQIPDFIFLSPPTTRRSTVEVFDPASTRDEWISLANSPFITLPRTV